MAAAIFSRKGDKYFLGVYLRCSNKERFDAGNKNKTTLVCSERVRSYRHVQFIMSNLISSEEEHLLDT